MRGGKTGVCPAAGSLLGIGFGFGFAGKEGDKVPGVVYVGAGKPGEVSAGDVVVPYGALP